ncbi:MAG: hypothetical protein P1P87_12210 [Trueperaceae bacterium]|nr:hypothetical protein [Trueperaceae bacterium]
MYALLRDLGMRTTKSVWPIRGQGDAPIGGATCEDQAYLEWALGLQRDGFEIAFHNAAPASSPRREVERGLEVFRNQFGAYPKVHTNHGANLDALYWGAARLTGPQRWVYERVIGHRRKGRDAGTDPDSVYFWGDLAQAHITYVRNFVYHDIDTLACCPFMPYHDPARPFVNFWFASSEGADRPAFCRTIREENQDRLEEAGGACIMYTHFGVPDFRDGKRLHPRFVELMTRLAEKGGWFVPVGELLDHLRTQRGDPVLTPASRRMLERRWLLERLVRARRRP